MRSNAHFAIEPGATVRVGVLDVATGTTERAAVIAAVAAGIDVIERVPVRVAVTLGASVAVGVGVAIGASRDKT